MVANIEIWQIGHARLSLLFMLVAILYRFQPLYAFTISMTDVA